MAAKGCSIGLLHHEYAPQGDAGGACVCAAKADPALMGNEDLMPLKSKLKLSNLQHSLLEQGAGGCLMLMHVW